MSDGWIQRNAVAAYVILAYGITWLIAFPMAFSYRGIIPMEIPLVLHYILPFGPMLASLIVTKVVMGNRGFKDLLNRMSKWRVGPRWIVIGLFSVWILYLLTNGLLVIMGQPLPDLGAFGQVMYLPYLTTIGAWLLWIFTYGIGEETGWRGFLLPAFQSKYGALRSSFFVSVIWAGWHIPMFIYNENLMAMGLIGSLFWLIGLLFGSVLLTWLYNSTKGSILITAIWHGTFNLFTAAIGQAADSIAGIISMCVMVWVVIIIAIYGRENLSKSEKQQSNLYSNF
jgi:membrane protease YdiL (CAAX protease family)